MIEPKNALDVALPPQAADAELKMLQHESFSYFLHETNPDNGLVIDKTAADWPASIAATGFALAAYPVAVERGFMRRAAAVERTLTTLRFFWNSPQGPEPDATGYQGFYYHFLDMRTGRRAWQCELSTIDSAFLLAGALTAGFILTRIRPTRLKSAPSPTRSIAARIGNGRKTAAHWSRTDGSPKADFSNTVGKATMRRCCSISWGWARPLIRCPRAATPRGLRLTGGNTFTDMNIFTPGRCSRTSSRMSGLTFAAFRTRSCASRASTISRTAVAPLMCNNSTRWTIRSSLPAMAAIAGELPRATVPAQTRSK